MIRTILSLIALTVVLAACSASPYSARQDNQPIIGWLNQGDSAAEGSN